MSSGSTERPQIRLNGARASMCQYSLQIGETLQCLLHSNIAVYRSAFRHLVQLRLRTFTIKGEIWYFEPVLGSLLVTCTLKKSIKVLLALFWFPPTPVRNINRAVSLLNAPLCLTGSCLRCLCTFWCAVHSFI